MEFRLHHTDGKARNGELKFERGTVRTPAFMPVGTRGTVKTVDVRDLRQAGAEMVEFGWANHAEPWQLEAAIDDFFVAVNMDKRSMEARLRSRERARQLYELAAETTAALAAKK